MSNTPETDTAVLDSDGQWSFVLKECCQRLERERNKALESLAFIAEFGGKAHETECGDILCDGDWCAEQARFAIYSLKENQ